MTKHAGWHRIVGIGLCMVVALLFVGRGRASAANVLLLSTGNDGANSAMQSALQGLGHTVTIGPQYYTFDGSNLLNYDAVLLVPSYNYGASDMPAAGQQALLDFVTAGGGLVTGEWLVWKVGSYGQFGVLRDGVPVVPTSFYTYTATETYTKNTPDDILNAGVNDAFTFQTDNVSGAETLFAPAVGSTVFYDSAYPQAGAAGVIGWRFGAGGVISISTTIGPTELGDANYRQLLANAVTWVTTPQ